MRKSLKSLISEARVGKPMSLLDMNRFDWMERAGFVPDLKHNKSAHMSAGWRFADHAQLRVPMGKTDLSAFRYLTFSVFSSGGEGGSFRLQFDSPATGEEQVNGYERVFAISRNGWNDYRVELPFLHTVGSPYGWNAIESLTFDCVGGGQSNSTETVLYFDSLLVWEVEAPRLYQKLPELKGAVAFSKTGNFAIADRKRLPNSIDGADASPFEEDGILWLPMAPVAAVFAHSAVADNLAHTLNFTYRRKKYEFSKVSVMMADGEAVKLGFTPREKGGMLFFPADFVREFFRWRQLFVSPMGLVVLSNRRAIFDHRRDEALILTLLADLTFLRPDADRVLEDLRRRYPNPARGRLVHSYDAWMQLRKSAKTDEVLGGLVNALKQQYGTGSQAFRTAPTGALQNSGEALLSFATFFRVTGDKKYAERAYAEAEALAGSSDWTGEARSMLTLGETSFAMAAAYDWCRHAWSEGQKALLERAMLRNGIRKGLEIYSGKGKMWHAGSAVGAVVNTGMLALSIALSTVYPESARKLLTDSMRNLEESFSELAPDGGYAEGVSAWEKAATAMGFASAILQNACGTDYGYSSFPGFASTALFSIFAEGPAGAWNYHNARAGSADTSALSLFGTLTDTPLYHQLRRVQIKAGRKTVSPLDIIFYIPIEGAKTPVIPLDAVYRKAGIAVMRASWHRDALYAGLHGGSNRTVGADLDAGSILLDWQGERFFEDTGMEEELPLLLRRRAEGQNTFVINPPTEPSLPDQDPAATASFEAMKSNAEKAFAVVDMTKTNHALLRAKRGLLLAEHRSLVVVQDEITLAEGGEYVFRLWTRAEVQVTKSGKTALLKKNGKTLACRLCGTSAKLEAHRYGETAWTSLVVRTEVKDKLRLALACRMLAEGETGNETVYTVTPISRWGEEL